MVGDAATGIEHGVSVSVALPDEFAIVALMDTSTLAVTPDVEIVKVAVFAPPATVTLAGTVTSDVLLLASVTDVPPAGAWLVRVTVPIVLAPPITVFGTIVTLAIPIGMMFSVAAEVPA
jgi:hypothetical protein